MIVYYVLFIMTVAFALGVLLNKDTVRSAMCLVGVMTSLAVNYLLMRQEFVAFIQVIVYAGAIMVLFLFVIMLLNLRDRETTPWYLRNARFWGGTLALGFFFLLAWGIYQFSASDATAGMVQLEAKMVASGESTLDVIARKMMTEYIVPFVLTSVLLLVAVIGAICMARRKDEDGNEILLEAEKN
jgi:NADH-quinone oxidoreductase subunit J